MTPEYAVYVTKNGMVAIWMEGQFGPTFFNTAMSTLGGKRWFLLWIFCFWNRLTYLGASFPYIHQWSAAVTCESRWPISWPKKSKRATPTFIHTLGRGPSCKTNRHKSIPILPFLSRASSDIFFCGWWNRRPKKGVWKPIGFHPKKGRKWNP